MTYSFNWPLTTLPQTYPTFNDFSIFVSDGTLGVALDTYNLYVFEAGTQTWSEVSGGGGGGGVSSVSVVSANGLAGTVANATTTPAITLSTYITGILKGDGTTISGATAGTDYINPNAGTYTDGQIYIGNTTTGNLSLTTLTAGTGMTVTNGHGSITLASSGGAIVETGSYGSPSLISTSITVPSDLIARLYVAGDGSPSTNPTIGNGSDTQQLYIFGCDSTNTVQLSSTTNLILSGTIILQQNSQILLHWIDGATAWVEASRNEIT